MAVVNNNLSSYILAVDVGFRSTGLVVFDASTDPARLVYSLCSRPKKDSKKKHLLVADSDADHIAKMVREIKQVIDNHGISKMVVELPSAGAQGARANRAMGIATGMIVTLSEMAHIATEWYTPGETRKAALGALKPPKGMLKDAIMDAMESKWPDLKSIKHKADKEHIADAVATFEAAKNGNLVRMSLSRNTS
jgi:Holliday junction resolvasome RuvABC endonuclease subunit